MAGAARGTGEARREHWERWECRRGATLSTGRVTISSGGGNAAALAAALAALALTALLPALALAGLLAGVALAGLLAGVALAGLLAGVALAGLLAGVALAGLLAGVLPPFFFSAASVSACVTGQRSARVNDCPWLRGVG